MGHLLARWTWLFLQELCTSVYGEEHRWYIPFLSVVSKLGAKPWHFSMVPQQPA